MAFERILMKHVDVPNSTSLSVYKADGGYEGAAKALQMKSDELVNLVKQANVRGRGGGGFPGGSEVELPAGRARRDLSVRERRRVPSRPRSATAC